MKFGNGTTDWKRCEGMGCFYRLEQGTLMYVNMMADGSMETYGEKLNIGEVDFYRIDSELAEQCKLIGRVLAGESFEGEKGDVLPVACEKCLVRFGDDCQC